MDSEKFKEFYPDLKQANEEDLQSIVNDMGDSNFMSIADERPMEALNEMDAYNFMLQDIPMFRPESTVKLAKARGDFKMSNNYQNKQINKEIKQIGSQDDYINAEKAKGLSGERKSRAVLVDEYIAKIKALKGKLKK